MAGSTFELCHGDRIGYDVEAALLDHFPGADCIIHGHTHRPAILRHGSNLFVNPGNFRGSETYGGRYTGTTVTIDSHGLSAAVHALTD